MAPILDRGRCTVYVRGIGLHLEHGMPARVAGTPVRVSAIGSIQTRQLRRACRVAWKLAPALLNSELGSNDWQRLRFRFLEQQSRGHSALLNIPIPHGRRRKDPVRLAFSRYGPHPCRAYLRPGCLFPVPLKLAANSACAPRDLLSKPRSELTYVHLPRSIPF